jgi:hypothetical protein
LGGGDPSGLDNNADDGGSSPVRTAQLILEEQAGRSSSCREEEEDRRRRLTVLNRRLYTMQRTVVDLKCGIRTFKVVRPYSPVPVPSSSQEEENEDDEKQFQVGDRVYVPKDPYTVKYHDSWGAWGRISQTTTDDDVDTVGYEVALVETGQRVHRPPAYIWSYRQAMQEMYHQDPEDDVDEKEDKGKSTLPFLERHPPPKDNFEQDGPEGTPFIPPLVQYDVVKVYKANMFGRPLDYESNEEDEEDEDDDGYLSDDDDGNEDHD